MMKKKIGDLTLRKIRQFCNKFKCFMCPLIDYCDKEPLDDDFIETLDAEIEVEEDEYSNQ